MMAALIVISVFALAGACFRDYAALHLQLAAMHPRLNDGLAYSYCSSSFFFVRSRYSISLTTGR
jgi:hypothetical protein